MSKKLLIGLAPFVAIVAFVVMPAVSQAAVPHFYKNGTLASEGEKIPVVSWGKLTLEPQPVGLAANTTCENLAGGYVENPTGGGAGVGATLRFATYNCTNTECPTGEVEIAGHKFEKEFEVVSNPEDLPWPSLLTEEVEGVIRTESKDVNVQLACMAHGFTRQEAGEGGSENKTGIGSNEQFVLPAGGNPTATCVTTATNKQEPQNEKGSSASNPSKVVFNAGAGELSCDGGAFTGKTKESLKIQGYKAEEVITTK